MKRLYIDMDNTLVDFASGISRLPETTRREIEALPEEDQHFDDVPGIFALMDPLPGAVEAYRALSQVYDTYILSTAPWNNPSAWADKLEWVKHHLDSRHSGMAYKRLILSHHKNLLSGDVIVDDRTRHGVDRFQGEHIHFGTAQWPNWETVTRHLLPGR